MSPGRLIALADALVALADELPSPEPDAPSVQEAWVDVRPQISAQPGEPIPNYGKALRSVASAGFAYSGQADETDAYLDEADEFYGDAAPEQTWGEWAAEKAAALASPVTSRIAAAEKAVADKIAAAEKAVADKFAELKEAATAPVEEGWEDLKNAMIAIGLTGVLVVAISASAGRGRRR
jgi:hypothetical protein